MVQTIQDLEGYFIKLDRPYEVLPDGTFLIAVAHDQPAVAVRLESPLVVLQVQIGEIPAGDVAREAKFFRKLLELNATDLVHAAYGLEGTQVILSEALEADNLDLNELEASLADMGMALSVHVPLLRQLAGSV